MNDTDASAELGASTAEAVIWCAVALLFVLLTMALSALLPWGWAIPLDKPAAVDCAPVAKPGPARRTT